MFCLYPIEEAVVKMIGLGPGETMAASWATFRRYVGELKAEYQKLPGELMVPGGPSSKLTYDRTGPYSQFNPLYLAVCDLLDVCVMQGPTNGYSKASATQPFDSLRRMCDVQSTGFRRWLRIIVLYHRRCMEAIVCLLDHKGLASPVKWRLPGLDLSLGISWSIDLLDIVFIDESPVNDLFMNPVSDFKINV